MTWTEKETPTPFDDQPIVGLYYLDGDVLARHIGRDWTKGQKYPMVAFPSGETFDLWESADPEQVGIAHLFGEMDLPLKDSRDSAYDRACSIAEQCGYGVQKVGAQGLAVQGHDEDEHFLIVYDPQAGQMADVMPVTAATRRFAEEELGGVIATERPIPPGLDLFPQTVRETLPSLYSGEEQGLDALAQAKYFSADAGWTWWASECSAVISDGEATRYLPLNEPLPEGWQVVDHLFFGLVSGYELELGYFALSELQAVRGPLGLAIERDLYFTPATLGDLQHQQRHAREA